MNQSAFPKDLVINGNLWKVKFVRSLKEHDTDTTHCFGLCDPGDRIIYIRKGQSKQDRMDTFFHELAHAIAFEYDLDDVAHRIIHKIGHVLAQTYFQNFE